MQLQRIEFRDIAPNERNPRDDFSSVDRLAANLRSLEGVFHGEPINPIIVIKDGSKYRIVDGERRWRAMKKNGLKSCSAYVCDGWDDADQLLAAIATDDKEPLTAIEKSRGVQEFMALGIADDAHAAAIEGAANLKPGTYGIIATAYARAGEAKAYNATIDQLIAAEEFADDPEVYNDILSSEDDWSYVHQEAIKTRKRKVEADKMEKTLVGKGFEVHDEPPDGEDFAFGCYCYSNEDLIIQLSRELPEGLYFVLNRDYNFGPSVAIYKPREVEATAEEIEREEADREKQEKADQIKRLKDESMVNQAKWLVEAIDSGAPLESVIDSANGAVSNACGGVESLLAYLMDNDIDFTPAPTWQDLFEWFWTTQYCSLTDPFGNPHVGNCSDWVNLLEIIVDDGYEITPTDQVVRDFCVKALSEE